MEIEVRDDAEYEKWLRALGPRERAKAMWLVRELAEHGEALGFPHVRWLGRGLFELRVTMGNQPRVYFTRLDEQRAELLTFGSKDTQDRDIARARRRMQ